MDMIKVIAKDKDHLKQLIEKNIKHFGVTCNLNYIDVSGVTDMACLFKDSKFDGDISCWDVSNVTDMFCMFESSKFNGDISNWDVLNVTNMYSMFEYSSFNGDINNWNVSNVTDMNFIFDYCPLAKNNNLPKWYKNNYDKSCC